jgi:enoyl-[acyl-carrier protein] reductase III
MPEASTSFQLNGTFIVTGGTRGIGRAITLQFARAGARVIANYLRDEKSALALKLVADQEALPIEFLRADVTSTDGLKQVEARIRDAGLPLCGLIHCAATGTHRNIDTLTGRHLDWSFALNVRALFDLVKQLLPLFDGLAAILAISSTGATRAVPLYTAVGTTKGAIEALIRHFAVELAPRGIRANILTPGAVATEAWKSIPNAEVRLADAERRSPLGRLVTVEEVALCAQFLCSPAASAITGQTLIVDGGTMILA